MPIYVEKETPPLQGRPSSVSSELCLKKIFHALSGGHSTTIRQKKYLDKTEGTQGNIIAILSMMVTVRLDDTV